MRSVVRKIDNSACPHFLVMLPDHYFHFVFYLCRSQYATVGKPDIVGFPHFFP